MIFIKLQILLIILHRCLYYLDYLDYPFYDFTATSLKDDNDYSEGVQRGLRNDAIIIISCEETGFYYITDNYTSVGECIYRPRVLAG